MKIALVGLPSAGKSSAVNALIGRRECVTGATRTTTEKREFKGLKSDDGVDYDLIDLPGLADSEDTSRDFDKLSLETIRGCQLVLWVSDVHKCFISQHELTEFNKISAYIEKLAYDEGISVQLGILVTKIDRTVIAPIKKQPTLVVSAPAAKMPAGKVPAAAQFGELSDDEPETTVLDLYFNLREKMPDSEILPFNAFGRSYHHPAASDKLKAYISKSSMPSNHNIAFNVQKFADSVDLLADKALVKHCIKSNFEDNLQPLYLPNCITFQPCTHNMSQKTCQHCKDADITKIWHSNAYPLGKVYKTGDASKTPITLTWSNLIGCTLEFNQQGTQTNYTNNNIGPSTATPAGYLQNEIYSKSAFVKDAAAVFVKTFDKLKYDESRRELINFLINGTSYAHNELARMIKLNCAAYLPEMDSADAAFRALTITSDLTLPTRIKIYSKIDYNIRLKDKFVFYSGPIYNPAALNTVLYKPLATEAEYDEINKKSLGTTLYSSKFIAQVKKMRKDAFGADEDDINSAMIPIAYDRYGLFWSSN